MNNVTPNPILPNEIGQPFFLKLGDYLREHAQALNQAAALNLFKSVSTAAAYTSGLNDHIIKCTAGPYTVTIPSASSMVGKKVTVKRADSGTSTLTIQSASGNIDGSATVTLTTAYQARTLYSDGSAWHLI